MAAVITKGIPSEWRRATAWLPLLVLPLAGWSLASDWPAWALMWALAVAVYAGLKWLSLVESPAAADAPLSLVLAYLFLWPGMNADMFLRPARSVPKPVRREWLWALAKSASGVGLVGAAAWLVPHVHPLVAGWLALAGFALLLHFGHFHLLSLAWRNAGVDAPPLMNAPIAAPSLSDFWSRRWNMAFRDLAYRFVFQPLVGRMGVAGASLMVFFVSGVIHDLVISIPAGSGLGLPTLYFLLQGGGVLIERSRAGRRLGLGRGWAGRAYGASVVLLPAGLLFHGAFIERVVLPMLVAMREA